MTKKDKSFFKYFKKCLWTPQDRFYQLWSPTFIVVLLDQDPNKQFEYTQIVLICACLFFCIQYSNYCIPSHNFPGQLLYKYNCYEDPRKIAQFMLWTK